MCDEAQKPAPPTPMVGLIITIVGIAVIAGWIFIGLKLLGISSFFASFLFFWYWAAVEEADLKQWPQSALGALVGLALAWQSHWLAGEFGTQGLIAGLIVIVIAVYIQIMNWVPLAINRSAMLFLTVLGLSALLGHGYTVDNRAQPEMATFGVFRRRVPPIAMQNRRLPLDHWGQVVVRSDFR